MDIDELKHKLRELKKLEAVIRFENRVIPPKIVLVWDRFFSTKNENSTCIKYNLSQMLNMDKERIREIYEEFFYQVYYCKYRESGMGFGDAYDPGLLSFLGLPPTAASNDIKKRFRELAQKYHPDHGGCSDKMIELLDVYHKLTDKGSLSE